jgi:NADPH2:quinone reductase
MAEGGTIFLYGALDPAPTPFPLRMAFTKNLTLRIFSLLSAVTTDPQALERGKRFVIDGLAAGHFKPLIAKTFPLDRIVEAHRYLESNQQVGKIIVTI